MAKTGRPAATLDDWLDWQQRLKSQQASGLSVDVYCLQEGVTRSSFYRWLGRLKNGVPESLIEEEADRQHAESEEAGEAVFLPISLKASPVEIELPNGGVVRLPLGVGQTALIAVIEVVGTLRPWKAPQS
jgi:hypothetical protein